MPLSYTYMHTQAYVHAHGYIYVYMCAYEYQPTCLSKMHYLCA